MGCTQTKISLQNKVIHAENSGSEAISQFPLLKPKGPHTYSQKNVKSVFMEAKVES